MLWNDLKSAYRNMKKHKRTTLIKGTGLAVGIAFFILLAAYVRDEVTYDRFHPRADKIYLVTNELRDRFFATSPHFLAEILKAEYPEVREIVRLSRMSCPVRSASDLAYRDIGFADPKFLKIFNFPLLLGDPGKALDDPGWIVLSLETARTYFGGENPLGKTLPVRLGNGSKDFLVSGVMGRIPGNSSIRFDGLVNYRNMFQAFGFEEANYDLATLPLSTATFLVLDNEGRAAGLRAKLPALKGRLFGDISAKFGIPLPKRGLDLMRFQDYHLGEVEAYFFEPRGKAFYSFILSGIALLVLLLACFNSINLSLGQSAARLKEIALLKTIGSRRAQLIRKFLADSLLHSLLASALGLALATFFLPSFNALTGKSLDLRAFQNAPSALFLGGLVLFTGLAAGAYPALLLSRQNPVDIFRGRSIIGRKGAVSRSILVFQFAVAVFFMFGTAVMAAQLRFLAAKNLGFNPQGVIAVDTQLPMGAGKASREMLELFKAELRSDPGISAVTGDSGAMGASFNGFDHTFIKDGREISVLSYMVGMDYLDTMGISLLQGRDFSLEYGTDPAEAALVNETLVRRFGIADPVGRRFSEFATDNSPKGFGYDPVIIGVVRDFHVDSLHSGIAPAAFSMFDQTLLRYHRILARTRGGNVPGVIARIKKTWERISPDRPFTWEFLDEALGRQYGKERNWSRILAYSAGAAVLIACLGLFGMAALAAARRAKEIGIRKVLGGTSRRIILTLSREFVLMIGLAHIIAWPLAYFAGRRWLEGFAYRTGIGPWVFILSSGLVATISLLTLCGQALRVALTDPVQVLRRE